MAEVPESQRALKEAAQLHAESSIGLRNILGLATKTIEESVDTIKTGAVQLQDFFVDQKQKFNSSVVEKANEIVGVDISQHLDELTNAIQEFKKPTDDSLPPILNESSLRPIVEGVNTDSNRKAYESSETKAIDTLTETIKTRIPKGAFGNLLKGILGLDDDDDQQNQVKGGGLLSKIFGFAGKILGLFGSIGAIGGIMAIAGTIGMLGSLILAIATDSPLSGAIRVIVQGIRTLGLFIEEVATTLFRFGKALFKGETFDEALKLAKFGDSFPKIEKFLTGVGKFLDPLLDAFLKRPPVLKGVGAAGGILAKLAPALSRLGAKGIFSILPFVGSAFILGFAVYRFSQGDLIGGIIDLVAAAFSLVGDLALVLGGAASTVTVGGAAIPAMGIFAAANFISLGLGLLNAAMDIGAGEMTPRTDANNQKQKAAFAIKWAKRMTLKQIVKAFSFLINVGAGIDQISKGNLIDGLKIIGGYTPELQTALGFLNLDPEDIGMTAEEVAAEDAAAADPGFLKRALSAAVRSIIRPIVGTLTFGLAPILEAIFTIAKGGSISDALETMAKYIPIIGTIVDLTTEQPELGDPGAETFSDLGFNLFTFLYDTTKWIFKNLILKPIEYIVAALVNLPFLVLRILKEAVGDPLIWIGKNVLLPIVGFIYEGIAGIGKSILELLKDPFDPVKWIDLGISILQPFDNIGKFILNAFDDVWSSIKDWWNDVDIIGPMIDSANDLLSRIFDYVKADFDNAGEDFKNWLDTTPIISWFWKIIGPGYNPPGFLSKAIEFLVDGFKRMGETFKNWIKGFFDGETFTKFKDTTKDFISTILNMITEALGIGLKIIEAVGLEKLRMTAANLGVEIDHAKAVYEGKMGIAQEFGRGMVENIPIAGRFFRRDVDYTVDESVQPYATPENTAVNIVESEKSVKVEQMKQFDVEINNEQFDKLLNVHERTYDVLNVQITRALKDINESVNNIQNLGNNLLPIPQAGGGRGETFNAATLDRDMNR